MCNILQKVSVLHLIWKYKVLGSTKNLKAQSTRCIYSVIMGYKLQSSLTEYFIQTIIKPTATCHFMGILIYSHEVLPWWWQLVHINSSHQHDAITMIPCCVYTSSIYDFQNIVTDQLAYCCIYLFMLQYSRDVVWTLISYYPVIVIKLFLLYMSELPLYRHLCESHNIISCLLVVIRQHNS